MELTATTIDGVFVVEPKVFGDDRGFFMESWNRRTFAELGLDLEFVQDNHSRSARGVLRGLHYQNPDPQGKLVRVVSGAVFDVAVDLRKSSSTFGKWFGIELNASNRRMLWMPQGIAHGFLSLADGTDFIYKCVGYYNAEHEHSLLWNDPAVGIEWPLDGIDPILSAKDRVGTPLGDATLFA